MAQRLASALGHDLDRQAAVEIGRIRFELAECDLFAAENRIDEGVVLLAGQRTIDVIGAGAAGAGFVVARLKPSNVEVDGIAMNDRCDRIEESERGFTAEPADCFGQRLGCQGTGRDDDAVPVRRGLRDLFTADFDQRLAFQRRADRRGKSIAVDRERPAGGQLVVIRGAS